MNAQWVADRTTVGLFLRQAERLGSRTLFHYHNGGQWRVISWTESRELVLRLADRLIREGIAPGDRVAIMAPNSLEWLIADLGIQAAGGVTVPIYPNSTVKMTAQIVANSEARLAFVADDRLAAMVAPCRAVRFNLDFRTWLQGRIQDSSALARRLEALDPQALCTICYTSGTTGEPKGVMLAHRCIVDQSRCNLAEGGFRLRADDESLSFLPYAHVFGRINDFYVNLTAGGTLWISRGLEQLAQDIQTARPTVMVSVPRLYEKMQQRVYQTVAEASPRRQQLFHWALEQGRRRLRGEPTPLLPLADRLVLAPLRARLTGGRLRFFVSGGATLSHDVEEFFWTIGIVILNGWGMSETASGVVSNTEGRHRFETVGHALPAVRLKLAEDGEILAHAPGNMLGYYRNPSATAETLVDGWVKTGDIGELSQDGFLKITDRKKDLIKTAGGKFVVPQPLETRLCANAAIDRAVVIGDERPYVVALIVPDWTELRRRTGLTGEPESLVQDEQARAEVQRCIDELNSDLGRWETVKDFTLLADDFSEAAGELTPTLKVKRRVVQERYAQAIAAMYAEKRAGVTVH